VTNVARFVIRLLQTGTLPLNSFMRWARRLVLRCEAGRLAAKRPKKIAQGVTAVVRYALKVAIDEVCSQPALITPSCGHRTGLH